MQHINTQEPNSKLSQKILEDFCLAAVEAIKTQYGREYGFANENEKKRAAVFSELHIDGLEGLPTNNLIAEISCLSSSSKNHKKEPELNQ